MKRYEYDPETADGWKSYPVRIVLPGKSRCCGQQRILVRSKDGGFVTADCSKLMCGKQYTVTLAEFQDIGIWVGCPQCQKAMDSGFVPSRGLLEENYGFKCEKCQVYIWLSDLLPHYSDIFEG